MQSGNIVLVLGAGASMSYGYPSGRGLIESICTLGSSDGSQQNIIRKYSKNQIGLSSVGGVSNVVEQATTLQYLANIYDIEECLNFIKRLKVSKAFSIDDFIIANPDYAEIGKTAICIEILRRNNTDKLFSLSECWYQILYGILLDVGANSMTNEHNISIITFNYDISLEMFIVHGLINFFGISNDEAIKLLNENLDIFHVYGEIYPPGNPGELVNQQDYFNTYVKEISKDSIRTISNPDSLDDITAEVAVILNKAKSVYFLGFGFNATNMHILGMKDYDTIKNNYPNLNYVSTTTVNIKREELRVLQRKYGIARNGIDVKLLDLSTNCFDIFRTEQELVNLRF